MSLSRVVLAMSLYLSVSTVCSAGVPVFRLADSIAVSYPDGSYAQLSCKGDDRMKCELLVRVDAVDRRFDIDFTKIGGVPRLNFLHLVSRGDPFFATVTTGYYCSEDDDNLLWRSGFRPEDLDSVECAVSFSVFPNDRVEWHQVRVLPQQQVALELSEDGARTGVVWVNPKQGDGPRP